MDADDLRALVAGFVDSARTARRAGMDGVEIHAAHPHLLGVWLTPGRNRRRDEYGGSLENRLRLVLEILRAVRDACPRPFVVGVRINGAWNSPGGQTLDEGVEIARLIRATDDADFLNVSGWPGIGSIGSPLGAMIPWARAVKDAVPDLPVMGIGRVVEPAQAAAIIAAGDADLVGMTRASIADPFLPAKARAGHVAGDPALRRRGPGLPDAQHGPAPAHVYAEPDRRARSRVDVRDDHAGRNAACRARRRRRPGRARGGRRRGDARSRRHDRRGERRPGRPDRLHHARRPPARVRARGRVAGGAAASARCARAPRRARDRRWHPAVRGGEPGSGGRARDRIDARPDRLVRSPARPRHHPGFGRAARVQLPPGPRGRRRRLRTRGGRRRSRLLPELRRGRVPRATDPPGVGRLQHRRVRRRHRAQRPALVRRRGARRRGRVPRLVRGRRDRSRGRPSDRHAQRDDAPAGGRRRASSSRSATR